MQLVCSVSDQVCRFVFALLTTPELFSPLHSYGGRIHTKQFGQGYVELGANWCHGAHQANSIFNLACKFDLIELPLNLFDRGVGAFLHSSGNAIDQELAIKLYEELKIIEYSTVHLDPSEKRTLGEFVTL